MTTRMMSYIADNYIVSKLENRARLTDFVWPYK